jgi:hypothetical protein
MACCASCAVGGPCSGEQGCAGPLGRPAYYRSVSVDGTNASDTFEVGQNDPSQNGWLLYSAVTLGANAQLAATMALNGFWQSPAQLDIGRLEWSRGGVVWVPFPSFNVVWQDSAGSGNESTVACYARPVLGAITASPIVYSTSSAAIAANGADQDFTVPDGATDYMLALYRDGGLAGDAMLEELNVSGGATNTFGTLRYDNGDLQNGQAAGSDGYRPVPPGPGAVLRVTNAAAAGAGNAITATIRYRIDLTMTR